MRRPNRRFDAQQISPLGKTGVLCSELRNCRHLNTRRGLGQTQNVQSPEDRQECLSLLEMSKPDRLAAVVTTLWILTGEGETIYHHCNLEEMLVGS